MPLQNKVSDEAVLVEAKMQSFLIKNDVRPIALMEATTHQRGIIEDYLSAIKLQYIIYEVDEELIEIFIFKYHHLRTVIENCKKAWLGDELDTFDHWIMGKMFGYSELEIEKFLQRINKI